MEAHANPDVAKLPPDISNRLAYIEQAATALSNRCTALQNENTRLKKETEDLRKKLENSQNEAVDLKVRQKWSKIAAALSAGEREKLTKEIDRHLQQINQTIDLLSNLQA